MKRFFGVSVLFLSLLIISCPANAFFLIDTGEGSDVYYRGLDNYNQHAIPFTLDKPYTINSLEYWIQSRRSDRLGTAKFSVLNDEGGAPGSNVIFSGSELIEAGDHWDGLKDLNLFLGSGQYWFAVDNISDPVPSGSGYFYDVDIGLQQGQVKPLSVTAFRSDKSSDPWMVSSSNFFSVGARIDAKNYNVVPEPATFILFASGLGVLIRRRKKLI